MEFILNINREDYNKSGIYIIKNNINQKTYIGSTNNFKRRYDQHKDYLKKNNANYKFIELNLLYPDIIYDMSILEITNDYKKLEFEYIKKYNTCINGLNVLENEDFNNFFQSHSYLKQYKRKLKKQIEENKKESSNIFEKSKQKVQKKEIKKTISKKKITHKKIKKKKKKVFKDKGIKVCNYYYL